MATTRIEQYAAATDSQSIGGVGAILVPPLTAVFPSVGQNTPVLAKTRFIRVITDGAVTSGVASSITFIDSKGVLGIDFSMPPNSVSIFKIPQEEAQTGLCILRTQA